MALHLEYRPKTFNEVMGNESMRKSLMAIVKRTPEKRPHTYLFQGPSGCGKTTIARILAREFGCNAADLTELDAAKDRNVEAMRALVADAQFSPMSGKCRVFIIDEVHELPKMSQETLLKTTEDTPLSTYFMLCTTEPEKIIKTIKNRCSTYQVQPLRENDMFYLLDTILTGENDDKISEAVINKIIDSADGSPRKALVILDQVLALSDASEKDRLALIQTINLDSEVIDLCRALISGANWDRVRSIYSSLPQTEPETVRRSILGYMKVVLLKGGKSSSHAAAVIETFRKPYYDSGEAALVADLYHASINSNRKERF